FVGIDSFTYRANDGTINSAVAGKVTLNITLGSTTTSLASAPNPANPGQNVTFVVGVSGGGTITGAVTLFDSSNGNASIGSGSLANGSASITTSFPVAGLHNIYAYYGGDSTHLSSTSNTVAQTIGLATTTPLTNNAP